MNPVAILKRVSFKNILKVIFVGVRRPLLVIPTIKATRECISISTKSYGKLHHKNGPANAFRHALWNYLIAKRCSKWTKEDASAIKWAQQITDWHENAFPNNQLARKMDFHNNEVGRMIFKEHSSKSVDEVVQIIQQMTRTSAHINETSDLSQYKNQLVHITQQ